ncbi:universal stress protein [uncultured Sunxiuqinia sp.]|uniref:universal stress protein n=1 Tax=uncultured Sunxiuqinia sp. TaxID=1573825 RepID=UPI002AA8F12C|nr:universal stress protein [uncultured Sunxiuqinia sp.]
MEEKIITIALLPYSKAEVLRSLLEAKGIDSSLENINLIQGAVATGVKVRIHAKDAKKAYPVLNKLLGETERTGPKSENFILIPVDFSGYSLKAASMAFEIANKLDSSVVFYHVIPQPDYFTIPYSDVMAFDAGLYEHLKAREEAVNENFIKFLSKLKELAGQSVWESVKMEQIVKMGYPEEDILAYTELHPPRLIVMGIKGPSEDSDAVMGSTTAGVIYRAEVPVLVIPEKAPLLNLASVKKVVYATNFDEKDFVAIDKLVGILKPFNTETTCLHIGDLEEGELAKTRLQFMKKELKRKYKDDALSCEMVHGRDVLSDLENYIRDNEIDILSLTTHKRNMITRIFNPSIARKMVFHLKTPLLVFHA